jgi:hypothetical protein
MDLKRVFGLHPILFAVYPVLFIGAHNIGSAPLTHMIPPLALMAVVGAGIWYGLALLLKDTEKAGITTSLFLLLFFAYGRVYLPLEGATLWGLQVGRHRYLMPLAGFLLVAAHFGIRKLRDTHGLTRFLDVTASLLVLFSLFNIVSHEIGTADAKFDPSTNLDQIVPGWATSASQPDQLPDIYYIILDQYPRGDISHDVYGFDNSTFLNDLASEGFYVARKSRSNYLETKLSIPSSLNMSYLNVFFEQPLIHFDGPATATGRTFHSMIDRNTVARYLEQYGYRFVAVNSGYFITEATNADKYFTTIGLSLYTSLLRQIMRTTPIPGVASVLGYNPDGFVQRQRIYFVLDRIKELPQAEAPTFLFAHIMCPHSPFSLGKTKAEQMAALNDLIMSTVREILAESSTPPVIIVHGDHGVRDLLPTNGRSSVSDPYILETASAILNAYHFPGGHGEDLYADISPVNTFRVVLNRFFGESCELLDDVTYGFGVLGPPDPHSLTGSATRTDSSDPSFSAE